MKTRTALTYLAVLLILAGYFYYFEVVRRKARTEQKEAALHLFQVERAMITSLQLDKEDSQPISLKKNAQWQIVEPISSRADEFAVSSLLTSLESLKMEREVETAAQDLQRYGLDRPKVYLSFLADGAQHYLRIGAKTVVGNQYYASGDQENRVVLIGATQQQALDKSLFDLRSKEFFTVKSAAVDGIEIERAEEKLALTKGAKERWQAEAAPEVKIKSSKVDSLLSRLLWLRAKRFLEKEAGSVAELGLAPAKIRVSLSTKEKTETLLLGHSIKDEGIYAKGNTLPGVALVDEKLLEELPGSLGDLEDRTLLTFNLDQIRAVSLELNGESARLERHEEKWKWLDHENRNDPENWRVNSLVWKLQELEYLPGDSPQRQSPPEDKQLKLVLLSEDAKLGTFFLNAVPLEKTERGILWFFKNGGTAQPYWVSAESLRDLHENAKKLLNPES